MQQLQTGLGPGAAVVDNMLGPKRFLHQRKLGGQREFRRLGLDSVTPHQPLSAARRGGIDNHDTIKLVLPSRFIEQRNLDQATALIGKPGKQLVHPLTRQRVEQVIQLLP